MGMTGAWFTDVQTDSVDTREMEFGTVSIFLDKDTETGSGVWTKLGKADTLESGRVVPGSEYHATYNIANNGNEDVYYKITSQEIKLTINDHTLTSDELQEAGITMTYQLDGKPMPDNETSFAAARRLNNSEHVEVTVVLKFPVTMGNFIGEEGVDKITFNAQQAVNLEYSITVEAIQVANYDPKTGNALA